MACNASKKTIGPTSIPAVPDPVFENIKIDEAVAGEYFGPCEPSICINLANTNNIAAGSVLNRQYWSTDGGRSWNKTQIKSSMGVFGDPVLMSDWVGNIYFAHLSDPENNGWRSEKLLDRIVIQKSTDGGKTYNDGSFCGFRHPKDQDKHWLCADPKTGHIAITWTEFDKYESKDTARDHSRIMFSKSINGGASWSEGQRINQFEGNCLDDDRTPEGAVPAFGPNGEIFVAWSWNEKIWFDRSVDGGLSWLKEDIVVAEQPGGWTFDIPGVSRCNGMPITVCDLSKGPNRGTLYINWSDQRNGKDDTDVWLSKSTDNGKTWSAPTKVNNDAKGKQQFLSWMAIDQTTGFLYVVFYDRRNHADNQTDVYLAVSKDGGLSFKNMKISKEPFNPNSDKFFGDYNNISAHGGIVRPIWTRLHNNVLSVWTAIIDDKN